MSSAKTRVGRTYFSMALLAILAAGSATAQESGLPDGGTLYVEFGQTDQIRWDAPDPNDDDTVAINNLRDLPGFNGSRFDCELALDGTEGTISPLLNIDGNGKTPGINDQKDQIGIREQKRGVDCGRVVANQSITLELGATLSDRQLKVVRSDVGLTVKKNVEIRIDASVEGGATEIFFLRSGNTVVPGEGNPPLTDPPQDPDDWNQVEGDSSIFNCNPASDSGPDSDAGCAVENLVAVWDTLTLTALAGNDGEFALGSGSSTFELAAVTGDLDCDQSTITAIDGATGAFGVLRRLANAPELECTGTCKAIPYYLNWAGNELQFFADYLENTENPQTCAAFAFTVNFAPLDISGLRPQDDPNTPDTTTTPPQDPYIGDDERAVLTSGDFEDTVTAQIPLDIVQQFVKDDAVLPDDPQFYLDTCLGTPLYATADNLPAYVAGDLVAMDFGVAPPPDLSNLIGTQYGCWLNIRLRYGVDNPDDDLPSGILPPGTGVEDELRVEVDGYLQGDWRLRY